MEKYKNSIDVVTSLCRYLKRQSDFKVFAYEKDENYRGDYIAVNSLSVNYGKWADSNLINLNIHAQDNSSGSLNKESLSRIYENVCNLIPYTNEMTETEDQPLIVDGIAYSISSDSNVMKDNDETHFINLRIKVQF